MKKFLFLLSVCSLIIFSNCKKGEAQTVMVTDTAYVIVHDTTVLPGFVSDTATTLIIVRHAEKEATGTDPNLTTDGQARAEELKRVLANIPVSHIYSTPLNRTRQTVQPLATAKGLTIIEYPAAQPYAQFLGQVITTGARKVSVIAGHSNTVPELLKVLSNNSFNITIADSQYDNLFILTVQDSVASAIQHLKYGAPSP